MNAKRTKREVNESLGNEQSYGLGSGTYGPAFLSQPEDARCNQARATTHCGIDPSGGIVSR
jgi:hypothetical protein